MDFIKTTIITLACIISGCANVNHYVGSVATLDQKLKFNNDKPYSYYDDAVSGRLAFEQFEVKINAYNTLTTERNFELFFVTVDTQEPYSESIGSSPFLIEVQVRGDLNTTEFYPYESQLNNELPVNTVKFKDPKPECNHSFTVWTSISNKVPVLIPDKNRNITYSCYKQGWHQYLLEFETETPNPQSEFDVTLTFKHIKSGTIMKKRVFFKPAKLFSVQTH